MTLIVQKYGGSSLNGAEAARNVATRIAAAQNDKTRVVAIVSAMGNTTDELLELAMQVSSKPDPRELDVLLSTGELVSCTLVTLALRSLGCKAISLSGSQAGIHTNSSHGRAKIAAVDGQRILKELEAGNIVVVAGFQGVTDKLDVTTLGRGGSDTTAVAIAAGIEADRCEIYTDVDGIYTADPHLVPNAQRLGEAGFEEMLEMASYGAKMNPRSVELGMVYDVPILVSSSFSENPGTLIHKGADMNAKVGELRKRVRSIATDTNVAKITVLGIVDRPGIAASLFEPLADADISVDVIVLNTGAEGATDLTFTVRRTDLQKTIEIIEPLAQFLGGNGVMTNDNMAKLSIVGTGMLDAPGYAAQMFRTLADNDINIEVITTSEIRITCIVDKEKVGHAARALHEAFDLDAIE